VKVRLHSSKFFFSSKIGHTPDVPAVCPDIKKEKYTYVHSRIEPKPEGKRAELSLFIIGKNM
jgi:hypothetical protein